MKQDKKQAKKAAKPAKPATMADLLKAVQGTFDRQGAELAETKAALCTTTAAIKAELAEAKAELEATKTELATTQAALKRMTIKEGVERMVICTMVAAVAITGGAFAGKFLAPKFATFLAVLGF